MNPLPKLTAALFFTVAASPASEPPVPDVVLTHSAPDTVITWPLADGWTYDLEHSTASTRGPS